ncbi:MAG TPA: hypothetical protein GXX14_14000 [Clostridiaceae bacterium]|nr:hypothetical protein [Clostridiaceae bacterium]
MDWARSKTILIMTLVVFNIVLLVNICLYRSEQNISRETIKNAEDILNRRGVTLKCDIPLFDGKVPALVLESNGIGDLKLLDRLALQFNASKDKIKEGVKVQSGSKTLFYDGKNTITYADASPSGDIDIYSKSEVEKYIRKYFSNLGFNMGSYILDEFAVTEDNNIKVTFIEKYKGYPIFSNYLKVVVSAEGIREFEYRHNKMKEQKGNSNNIMPAYQVLLKNFTNNKDAVITGIDIGYKSSDSENEMKETTEWPKWRVRVEGQPEPLYFNAIDGKKE